MLERLYSILLRLYPRSFQETYGEEMRSVFRQRLGEAQVGGAASRARLLWDELTHAPASLWSAYCLQARASHPLAALWQSLEHAFTPPEGAEPIPDGRDSWRIAALEVLPFAAPGAALILVTYLPRTFPEQAGVHVLEAALSIVLLPILAAGLLRGMPRWAYPLAGLLACASLETAQRARILGFWILAVTGTALLLSTAIWLHRRGADLPRALSAAGAVAASLRGDTTRLAFAFFGTLPILIPVLFADGFQNNRGPWLAVSVAVMSAGALCFARAREKTAQAAALAGSAVCSVGLALLDRAAVLDRLGAGLSPADLTQALAAGLFFALFLLAPFLAFPKRALP